MDDYVPVCPACRTSHRQTKAGKATNGNQRYQCQDCKRYYVQDNRRFRYPENVRQRALELHTMGMALRQIARELCVNHQTVANWLGAGHGHDHVAQRSVHTGV